ncbi:glycine receptor subunit beta-like [Penaeus japonicus]|uniref:glycine receptor subunit beta-like n=1 Tax=Penaeus japonicus TaxID=27405 RepID=UPI001C711DEF|nr:glycine receptor subunit beta-like [Penaeus japonicus]
MYIYIYIYIHTHLCVPPARVGDQAAQVALHVTLLSVQPLDTLSMKMTLDLTLTLKWRDPRLDMESLNYAETLNVIHDDELIWRPEVIFEDSTMTEADTRLHWQTFVAVMESGPLPDDVTRVREDEVYPGTKNSLKLTQTYRIVVSCQMDLESYPFDVQLCSFRLRLQYFTRDLVSLSASGANVEYKGRTNLREYEITGIEMTQSDWRNHSAREVVLRMENLSGFYVSSTYIPTFLMVVISYSTLFFELDDFNDRIMVSLTALLVLATLFTQITETTPKTAYLKLLDVWFVATILVNFSIVMLLVSINVLRVRESQELVVPFLKKKAMYPAPQLSAKINRYSQIALPVIVFILVITYAILSVTDYMVPDRSSEGIN